MNNRIECDVAFLQSQLDRIVEIVRRAVDEKSSIGSGERAFLRTEFNERTSTFCDARRSVVAMVERMHADDEDLVSRRVSSLTQEYQSAKERYSAVDKSVLEPTFVPCGVMVSELLPHAVEQVRQATHDGGRTTGDARPALTQKAVAALCCIKSGAGTIANWEKGRTKKVPCGYKKELREKGGTEFFEFVAEYLRTHKFNKELNLFLAGKVVYTDGLTERETGMVQDFINKRRQGLV